MGAAITAAVAGAIWFAIEMWQQDEYPDRFSFSLRTLMIIMTLSAMVLGAVSFAVGR